MPMSPATSHRLARQMLFPSPCHSVYQTSPKSIRERLLSESSLSTFRFKASLKSLASLPGIWRCKKHSPWLEPVTDSPHPRYWHEAGSAIRTPPHLLAVVYHRCNQLPDFAADGEVVELTNTEQVQ